VTEKPVQVIRHDSDTSSSLLIRVREKNSDAWQRLVYLYSPLISHWCRKCGLGREDAADIVQEVFSAVARAIEKFDHESEGTSFRGWLRRITLNKVRDHFRRQPPGLGVGGDEALLQILSIPDIVFADSSCDGQAEDELILLRQAVDLILSEFETVTQRAFLRVVVDLLTPADVARELDISVNSVYLAKSRIRRRLKEEFKDLIESL